MLKSLCDDSQLKSCQKEVKEGNVNRNKVDIIVSGKKTLLAEQ